jgi:hypothetical protein
VGGAGAARALDLPQEGLPGTVEPDPGVVGGDTEGPSGPVDGLAFQVHALQELRVLRLQRREQAHDAAAHLALELGVLTFTIVSLLSLGLDRTATCRFGAVSVDEGVAQQPVEPSDGRLPVSQIPPLLQGPHERALEHVLCVRTAPCLSYQEVEEAPVVVHERLENGVGGGVGCHGRFRRAGDAERYAEYYAAE